MTPGLPLLGVDGLPSLQFVLTLGGLLVVGIVVVVAMWVEFSIVHSALSHGSESDAKPKHNCPNCGARNPIDRATCNHCEHTLPDGTV